MYVGTMHRLTTFGAGTGKTFASTVSTKLMRRQNDMKWTLTIEGDGHSELTPAVKALVAALAQANENLTINTSVQAASNPMQPPQTVQAPISTPVTDPGLAATQVPTTTQTYTLDQLAVAATQLVDAGRREELVGLLASFGVQALTALPKEQYGAFATQLRAMGAKI
jgi:hypothetical protein